MIRTFICHHCGKEFILNPRIKKGQKFCNNRECQRVSRRSWKKKNYATNKSYRKKCLENQKAWRKKYPACDYQKLYRENHPDYVDRCRKLQNERYKKQREREQKAVVQNIVNGNTLFSNPSGDGVYKLIPVGNTENNVNRNTLMVRMQILSG